MLLVNDGREVELSGSYLLTTNNRMELLAAIVGLEWLPEPATVELTSDSRYVTNPIELDWLALWARRGWRSRSGTVKNRDLWFRMKVQLQRHRVTARHVRGHSGHPENERCDRLAWKAARGSGSRVDDGYLAELAQAGAPRPFNLLR